MNKQYTDGITKLGGPTKKITFKLSVEQHLESKKYSDNL